MAAQIRDPGAAAGWFRRGDDVPIRKLVDEVRLLSAAQMQKLFPDCEIHKERVFGLVKSLIAVRRPSPETASLTPRSASPIHPG